MRGHLEEALEELGEDEDWLACDVNRIALDAADLLEQDGKEDKDDT